MSCSTNPSSMMGSRLRRASYLHSKSGRGDIGPVALTTRVVRVSVSERCVVYGDNGNKVATGMGSRKVAVVVKREVA